CRVASKCSAAAWRDGMGPARAFGKPWRSGVGAQTNLRHARSAERLSGSSGGDWGGASPRWIGLVGCSADEGRSGHPGDLAGGEADFHQGFLVGRQKICHEVLPIH
ncbi:MAG: hypothetical protein ACK56I_27710, partial [bacterium]